MHSAPRSRPYLSPRPQASPAPAQLEPASFSPRCLLLAAVGVGLGLLAVLCWLLF